MKTSILIAWMVCLLGMSLDQAQEVRPTNVPSKTTSRTPVASGLSVLGVYNGRLPCAEILADWNQLPRPECIKMKWSLTLFHDAQTRQPTTYHLKGGVTRENGRSCGARRRTRRPSSTSWTPTNPTYRCTCSKATTTCFSCSINSAISGGDSYLSYTLNRVVN